MEGAPALKLPVLTLKSISQALTMVTAATILMQRQGQAGAIPQFLMRCEIGLKSRKGQFLKCFSFQFFSACSSRLKLPGDEKILVKLRKRYMEMDEDFRESSECQTLLESFIEQVKEQSNTYIILKEVIENFKAQARSAADPTASKKARIKKLERFLEVYKPPSYSSNQFQNLTCLFLWLQQKLDKEIKKLQEKEVDFDEEENSDYILECRYAATLSHLTNLSKLNHLFLFDS